MRDFRDAKAMARTLRAALATKGHKITIGESLELIAQAFGVADWNTLAAAIRAQAPAPRESAPAPSGESVASGESGPAAGSPGQRPSPPGGPSRDAAEAADAEREPSPPAAETPEAAPGPRSATEPSRARWRVPGGACRWSRPACAAGRVARGCPGSGAPTARWR